MLHVRQRKYEAFLLFSSNFIKLLFVGTLIELRDLSISLTIKLLTHHAFTSIRVWKSGESDRSRPLRAHSNSRLSGVKNPFSVA